mmetsp:Transcript_50881/g.134093  ORF Transcript_50881/g.134093 Transcript_50881/m.134093 type:complete len:283 (+) Transcript_50881:13-861(+)
MAASQRQALRSAARRIATIPGPRTQPVVGNFFNFDVEALFNKSPIHRLPAYDRFGDIWQVSIFGHTLVFVRDVDLIKEVVTSPAFGVADIVSTPLAYHFPQTMFSAGPEDWARMRKVIARAMQNYKLDPLVPSMIDICERSFAGVPDGSIANLQDHTCRITFDAFHRFAYNVDFNSVQGGGAEVLEAALTYGRGLGHRIRLPVEFLWSLPLPANKAIDAAAEALKAQARSLCVERQAALSRGEEPVGVFEHVLAAGAGEDSDGKLMEGEVIDNIASFFFCCV